MYLATQTSTPKVTEKPSQEPIQSDQPYIPPVSLDTQIVARIARRTTPVGGIGHGPHIPACTSYRAPCAHTYLNTTNQMHNQQMMSPPKEDHPRPGLRCTIPDGLMCNSPDVRSKYGNLCDLICTILAELILELLERS